MIKQEEKDSTFPLAWPSFIQRLILETTWTIAVKRCWLVSLPTYEAETEKYKFNINAGYFDRKRTAKRLQGS